MACAVLAACGSFSNTAGGIAATITPYKMDVVQGNFVSKEQVQALQTGMTRQQVKDVLGTPLMTSLFHADRWDYVFTLKRQGLEPQSRRLAVFFQGDALERWEGDEMPTEAEFVAMISAARKSARVPLLEASEESLARFPAPASAAKPDTPAPPPPSTSYPPLEAPAR